jgi:DNA-binding MarR family transcriptional regulator
MILIKILIPAIIMPYINNLSFEMKERQYAALQFNITCKMEIKAKAILFSMGDAVELKDLADVLQIDGKTVQKILDDMIVANKAY